MNAALNGRELIVEQLLDIDGLEIFHETRDGQDALSLAVQSGNPRSELVVSVLARHAGAELMHYHPSAELLIASLSHGKGAAVIELLHSEIAESLSLDDIDRVVEAAKGVEDANAVEMLEKYRQYRGQRDSGDGAPGQEVPRWQPGEEQTQSFARYLDTVERVQSLGFDPGTMEEISPIGSHTKLIEEGYENKPVVQDHNLYDNPSKKEEEPIKKPGFQLFGKPLAKKPNRQESQYLQIKLARIEEDNVIKQAKVKTR